MNLQQFEYLIALDQFKNFSKAADACFITQATMSTMVKKLEEELGIVIFDRKANPLCTTDSGKEVIVEAKKILEHVQRIREKASNLNIEIEGEINLGIIPTISSSLLHRLLPDLLDKYPNLHFNIEELTTKTIIQHLKSGRLDAGVISTPIDNSEMEGQVLYYEKLMVYGHIESNRKYLSPEDLTYHQMWLLKEGHCLREQIIDLCSLEPGNIKQNISFQPNTFDSLLNLVDKFGGLTLLPELYYKDLDKERKSKVMQFDAPYPVREVSLVYYRPFVKQRILQMLTSEIITLIALELKSSRLESTDLRITKINKT